MQIIKQASKQREKPLIETSTVFHKHLTDKDRDKIAVKNGFRNWQKLIQQAAKDVRKIKAPQSQVRIHNLDLDYKSCNWLGLLLSLTTTQGYKAALETVFEQAIRLQEQNFAAEYSTNCKAYVIEFWKGKMIESINYAGKDLVNMEDLFLLLAAIISTCIDDKRTSPEQILHGTWNLDFFFEPEFEQTNEFEVIRDLLINMFSEEVRYDILLMRLGLSLNDSIGTVNFAENRFIVAFYCYFNRYTTYLKKDAAIDAKMTMTAAFYLVGLLDNRSEVKHQIGIASYDWQEKMIDNLLETYFPQ